jgi:hypothetical protein
VSQTQAFAFSPHSSHNGIFFNPTASANLLTPFTGAIATAAAASTVIFAPDFVAPTTAEATLTGASAMVSTTDCSGSGSGSGSGVPDNFRNHDGNGKLSPSRFFGVGAGRFIW